MAVSQLASHVRFIEGSKTEKLPWSLIRPFEHLVKGILGGNPLILRPQWKYNYVYFEIFEVYKEYFKNAFSSILVNEIFKGMPDKLYIISFPGFERLNVLQHVILSHEVGHKLSKEFISNENKAYMGEIKNQVKKLSQIKKMQPNLFKDQKIAALTEDITNIRNKGLEEILCDLVSVHFFGIAAVLTLNSFSKTTGTFDEVSPDYHPPWRFRLRVVLKELNDSGFLNKNKNGILKPVSNVISKKIQFIKNITRDNTDITNISRIPHLQIAYESLNKALPTVHKFIEKELSGVKNALEFTPVELAPLIERLKLKVIPNHTSDFPPLLPSVNIQHIIVAGWLYKLAYLDAKYGGNLQPNYIKEMDILNRLILKAIEINHLQGTYLSNFQ